MISMKKSFFGRNSLNTFYLKNVNKFEKIVFFCHMRTCFCHQIEKIVFCLNSFNKTFPTKARHFEITLKISFFAHISENIDFS